MSFLTVCLNPTLQKTLRFPLVIPGTVNRTANHRLDASGKGINVTRVLTQLGKKAIHLTQLGGSAINDGNMSALFLSLCKQDKLSVEWVESNSQIRFCYTILADNDNSVTELIEESEAVAVETEQQLLGKFESILAARAIKCLIISGTKAAGFSDTVFPVMVKKAKEAGLRVILDLKGKDLIESLKHEPDIVKPNLFEFASTFVPELIKDNDLTIDTVTAKEKIKIAVINIARKYRCRIILTNGNREILAADGDNYFEVTIQPVKTVNSIGCGDAFTAGLAAALEDGESFASAIREGMRCGTLNAGFIKPGVIH